MNDRQPPLDACASREPTRAATAAGLSARFGVPVWWGSSTRRWWALLPGGRRGHLVEATDPYDLATMLGQALGRTRSR
jgi:hypothetical protein